MPGRNEARKVPRLRLVPGLSEPGTELLFCMERSLISSAACNPPKRQAIIQSSSPRWRMSSYARGIRFCFFGGNIGNLAKRWQSKGCHFWGPETSNHCENISLNWGSYGKDND